MPVANEQSYILPRKAELKTLLGGPLLGAVLPNSLRLFPGAVFFANAISLKSTLAGGVGSGYFACYAGDAGSNPALSASSGRLVA